MSKLSSNLGKVVIDWLELSYNNDALFKEEIIKIESEAIWRGYRIVPTRSYGYEYAFDVYWPFSDTPFAQIKFNLHAKRKDYHIVVGINNRIFYAPKQDFTDALLIGEKLGLVYNNIRRLDLAIDLSKDITRIINQYQHKKNIALRVNGKCIWKDNADTGMLFFANGNRKRNKLNGFVLHTSNNSASLKSYDKIKETTDKKNNRKYGSGYKDYILDYYNHPDRLYRLEVSARGRFIYDFIQRKEISSGLMFRMLCDEAWLTSLFHDWLSSILSFSRFSVSKTGEYRSRGGVKWNQILGVGCITSINYTQYAISICTSSVFNRLNSDDKNCSVEFNTELFPENY